MSNDDLDKALRLIEADNTALGPPRAGSDAGIQAAICHCLLDIARSLRSIETRFTSPPGVIRYEADPCL